MNLENAASYLVKEAELKKLESMPGGRQIIANLMLKPLVRDLLYESRVRQLYGIYQLGLGEEAYLDEDVSVTASQIAVSGLAESIDVKSGRDRIQTTPIETYTKTRWNESNYRKFDILSRTQARAKSAVMSREDQLGFTLIDYASDKYYTPLTSGGTNVLGIDTLAEAISLMSESRIIPHKLVINPFRQKDLLLLASTQATAGNLFMPEKSNENVKKGVVGMMWNLGVINVPNGESISRRQADGSDKIVDMPILSRNAAYVVTEPETLGRLAIRTDLTVETQKMVPLFSDVFAIWEDLGFLIKWSKGIIKIDLAEEAYY